MKCAAVLLHASIHKKPPSLFIHFNRLLWHIINFEAAVHVLLICYGICNWIWPPVTLKIRLSVPEDIHMFYEGRVYFNKSFNQEHMLNKQKAFIDFINSKTMSTLSQANHCTAYWSAMVRVYWRMVGICQGDHYWSPCLGAGTSETTVSPLSSMGDRKGFPAQKQQLWRNGSKSVPWSCSASFLHVLFLA